MSAWDQLLMPFGPFGAAYQGLGAAADSRRLVLRTGPYEELLRHHCSPRESLGFIEKAAGLRGDFKRRVWRWMELSHRLRDDDDFARFRRALVEQELHRDAGFWIVLLIPVVWCRRLVGLSTTMNLVRSLELARCPDCRYPLGDLSDPFGEPPAGELKISPPACPECGSPWPLLPPPVWPS